MVSLHDFDLVLGQNGRRLSPLYQDGNAGGKNGANLESIHHSLWALLNEPFWKGCLAPGDTSKEPVEACEKQVASNTLKGFGNYLSFLCGMYSVSGSH